MTTLYRVVQEALTNVLKHADAPEVHVVLQRQAHQVLLTVADNGRGNAGGDAVLGCDCRRRIGLTGMHERIAAAGRHPGDRVRDRPGDHAFVRLPLPPIAQGAEEGSGER